MPHADSSYLPDLPDKKSFYQYLRTAVEPLVKGQNWVSALANCSSLLYFAYLSSPLYGETRYVNWVGFYLLPLHFPAGETTRDHLLLGPFCGRPACQLLALQPRVPGGQVGVCATAFNQNNTVTIKNVHEQAGHIACDANTSSEIVVPFYIKDQLAGVLDLDSTAVGTFDEEDQQGLESIVSVLNREEIVLEFLGNWVKGDAKLLTSYFTDDALYANIPRPVARGKADIEKLIEGFFSLFKLEIKTERVASSGNFVFAQRIDWMYPHNSSAKGGPLPVTGIFELEDGKIKTWREYFDLGTGGDLAGVSF